MKLSDFIVNDAIIVDLQATEKQDAIEQMIDKLIATGSAEADLRDEMIASIMEREKHGSTGFGKGVAVPHVKHETIDQMAAGIAVRGAGVDFNALDEDGYASRETLGYISNLADNIHRITRNGLEYVCMIGRKFINIQKAAPDTCQDLVIYALKVTADVERHSTAIAERRN